MASQSQAGSFLHGITLCVDGGFDVYSGVGPPDERTRRPPVSDAAARLQVS